MAERFSIRNIVDELRNILPGSPKREEMLCNYDEIDRRLGDLPTPENTAREMISILKKAK